MNKLVIPPSPNWYEVNILACAPDNTVIYGSRSDLVIIKPKSLDEPADITVVSYAHNERITCVGISPSWSAEEQFGFSVGEDKNVKLWDIAKGASTTSHRGHTARKERMVGAAFAGNTRIISVAEDGYTIVWPFTTSGQLVALKDIFGMKVRVTCVSTCMHKPWLAAYGMKSGLIVVADLRQNGKMLYKLRGHDKSILSLTWCPSSENIFPVNKPKTEKSQDVEATENVEPTESDKNDQEPKPQKSSPWINLKHADDDEVPSDFADHPRESAKKSYDEDEDFLAACTSLKKLINETTSDVLALPTVDEIVTVGDSAIVESVLKEDADSVKDLSSGDSVTESDAITPQETDESVHASPETAKDKPDVDDSSITALTTEQIKTANSPKNSVSDILHELVTDVTEPETEEPHEIEKLHEIKEPHEIEEQQEIKEPHEIEESQETKPATDKDVCLLASTSRGERFICVWRALADGRLQAELSLPSKTSSRNRGKRPSDRAWITSCWNTPTTLLCSSPTGELFEWDLNKAFGKRPNLKPRLVHNDHETNLFAIVAPPWVHGDGDWRNEKVNTAWTVGQDRYILYTSLGIDREVLISYPTIGGTVLCLTASPLDPNRIGMGIGDGTARVWDLSKPQNQYVTMTNLWQRMHSRILSLAWHPTKEVILAYGTYEGRVGFVDTTNTTKSPTLMLQYFRTGIYNIEFGPAGAEGEKMGLYACSEGKLVVYDVDAPIEDPKVIETSEPVTQFSWKKDNKILAVGFKTGPLAFYSNDLKLIKNVYLQQKSVQCIVWHPESARERTDECQHAAGWLAVATNDTGVVVYDFHNINEGAGDQPDYIVAKLNGHVSSVKTLDWSPFDDELLVSAGEDGLALVWNVKTQTQIATFAGHNGEPIHAVMWSPLDADYVISGGKDTTVRVWKFSEHPVVENPEQLVRKLKKHAHRREESSTKSDEKSEVATVKPKKVNRDLVLSSTSRLADNTVASMLEDCERLFEGPSVEGLKVDALSVFGEKEGLEKFLDSEHDEHVRKGRNVCANYIPLWRGNIGDAIRTAVANETVTPWMIGVAPMVSTKLWVLACESYATKQSENPDSDPLETASYFLACHKVENAIGILRQRTLFREALALAKCRLAPDDPIIAQTLNEWASFCSGNGNCELGAQCYVALGEFEKAAKLLYRRQDLRSLELGVKLAQKTENVELQKAMEFRFNGFKEGELKTGDETVE